MGQIDAARVDVGVLLDVASRYDGLADVIDGLTRMHLARLSFDGSVAGRDYAARGGAMRQAVGEVADQTRAWSRSCREIASALRSSGAHYADVDTRSAARLG